MRRAWSEEMRGDEGEMQLDNSMQLRDAETCSREMSGEIGCLNAVLKTSRERES